jgi:hypothetical protein
MCVIEWKKIYYNSFKKKKGIIKKNDIKLHSKLLYLMLNGFKIKYFAC